MPVVGGQHQQRVARRVGQVDRHARLDVRREPLALPRPGQVEHLVRELDEPLVGCIGHAPSLPGTTNGAVRRGGPAPSGRSRLAPRSRRERLCTTYNEPATRWSRGVTEGPVYSDARGDPGAR